VQHLGPAVQLLGLGSYLATCIAGGPILGHFLDQWLDTGRAFTIAGLVLGLVVGFYGGYRMLTQTLEDMSRWQAAEQRKNKKRGEEP
jgi:F0F1-type ATP synthase assembly protein I